MESKLYLIVYSQSATNHEQVKAYLNQNGDIIKHWFYNINGTIFIKTTFQTATEVSQFFEKGVGKCRHFVTEVSTNRNGRLPIKHWALIKK